MKTTAAVLWERGGPWSVEEIDLDPPKAGEVLVELGKMGLRHIRSTARGHAVVNHRRRARHPQIPAMARFALHLLKDFPPRFVAMKQFFTLCVLSLLLATALPAYGDIACNYSSWWNFDWDAIQHAFVLNCAHRQLGAGYQQLHSGRQSPNPIFAS